MKKRFILLSFIIVLIDQIIKIIVMNNMRLYQSIEIIKNFFSITYVKNDGAAFSSFSGKGLILVLLAIIVLIILLLYIKKKDNISKIEMISYIMIIGGIIGNTLDRVIYGQVIDYLDFYIFGYNYPVFNFADINIVCGVILLGYYIIRSEKNDSSKGK